MDADSCLLVNEPGRADGNCRVDADPVSLLQVFDFFKMSISCG